MKDAVENASEQFAFFQRSRHVQVKHLDQSLPHVPLLPEIGISSFFVCLIIPSLFPSRPPLSFGFSSSLLGIAVDRHSGTHERHHDIDTEIGEEIRNESFCPNSVRLFPSFPRGRGRDRSITAQLPNHSWICLPILLFLFLLLCLLRLDCC